MKHSLFLMLCAGIAAAYGADMNRAFPPFPIAENLYYVGTSDLASYLVKTDQGDILINTDYERSVPLIEASIQHLGFRLSDIRIILISHAHDDHAAGCALFKRATGAKLMVMAADVPEIEAGGKGDFAYANQHWPAVHVDRILHDGDQVKLGGAVLTAHLTPGHTKGCTTWTMDVMLNGKKQHVVIVGSPNVNPGYKLVHNQQYPQIASDYRRTFRVLSSLPCDIFLGAHGSSFNLAEKYRRWKQGDANAFVDAAGYSAYVQEAEAAFEKKLHAQQQQR